MTPYTTFKSILFLLIYFLKDHLNSVRRQTIYSLPRMLFELVLEWGKLIKKIMEKKKFLFDVIFSFGHSMVWCPFKTVLHVIKCYFPPQQIRILHVTFPNRFCIFFVSECIEEKHFSVAIFYPLFLVMGLQEIKRGTF